MVVAGDLRAATVSRKRASKARKAAAGPSYKEMMTSVMSSGKSQEQITAEHRARLKAKIDAKDTRVTAAKFERI
eukprot:COSAG01_NODE_783_length_13630_cov_5.556459_12_plen_74_part_00